MTDNTTVTPTSLQEQSDLIQQIARDIFAAIDGEWSSTSYIVTCYGGQTESEISVMRPSGVAQSIAIPGTIKPLRSSLRRVMARPGQGSWFMMTMTLLPAESVRVSFDYETKPVFGEGMPGVIPYLTSREQLEFPRDQAHQPEWYAQSLSEFLRESQVKIDAEALRDRGWARIGQAGGESYSTRLVVLPSGVGVMATGGFSAPDVNHPDPGFELFMPSALFAGDADVSRRAWPFNGLNFLVRYTSENDVDWRAETAAGPVAVTYIADYSNDAPDDWRGEDVEGRGDVLGVLVGVPFASVPGFMPGLGGDAALIGVVPARPAEWEFLQRGGDERRAVLAQRLAALNPDDLASPTRESVF